MRWTEGAVALAIVVAAVILRWHRWRMRHWSVHLSIESRREGDEGPTPRSGPHQHPADDRQSHAEPEEPPLG